MEKCCGWAREGRRRFGFIVQNEKCSSKFLYCFRTFYRIEYWIIKVDRNLDFEGLDSALAGTLEDSASWKWWVGSLSPIWEGWTCLQFLGDFNDHNLFPCFQYKMGSLKFGIRSGVSKQFWFKKKKQLKQVPTHSILKMKNKCRKKVVLLNGKKLLNMQLLQARLEPSPIGLTTWVRPWP